MICFYRVDGRFEKESAKKIQSNKSCRKIICVQSKVQHGSTLLAVESLKSVLCSDLLPPNKGTRGENPAAATCCMKGEYFNYDYDCHNDKKEI